MMPCDSPPIGVNSLLLLHFAGPLTPSAVRFRYVTPRFYLFQRDQRLAAVVSLVGHYLRDSVDMNLRLRFRSILGFSLDPTPPLPRRLRPAFRALWWCRPDPPLAASPRSPPHFPCPPHAFSFVGHMRAAVFHLRDTPHLRRSRSSIPCSTFFLRFRSSRARSSRVGVEIPLFLAKSVKKASYRWPLSRRTMDRIALR